MFTVLVSLQNRRHVTRRVMPALGGLAALLALACVVAPAAHADAGDPQALAQAEQISSAFEAVAAKVSKSVV